MAGCIAFLISIHSYSQNLLTGTVTQKETGEAIPGATVYINDLRKGAVTDSSGKYRLENLPEGIFLVEYRFLGYKSEILKINIKNETVNNVSLEESHTELKGILITGVSATTEKEINPVPSVTMDANKLNELIGTTINDKLSFVPGINQISTGTGISKPVIRGLGFNRVLILQNNIRQEGQQWGEEHGLEIDEFSVSRAEIIKGPGSIAFGSDALAGVIHFLSPDPIEKNKQRIKLLSSYQSNQNLIGNSFLYEGNKNDIFWNLQGTQKKAGNYSNEYDGKVFNSGFEEYDGAGMVGISRKWGFSTISFSSFNQTAGIITGERDSSGNFTEHIFINDSTPEDVIVSNEELNSFTIHPPYQKTNHHKIVWNGKRFKGQSAFQYTAGYQLNHRREFEINEEGNHLAEAGINLLLHTANYDINYHFHFKEWETTSGINGYYQKGINLGDEFIIPDYLLNDAGIYVLTQKTLTRWHISGGIRYTNRIFKNEFLFTDEEGQVISQNDSGAIEKFKETQKTFSSFVFSGGASYRITENLIAKINFASGYRSPNVAELTSNGAHHGTFRYEIGNISLNPEISYQGDFSISAESKHVTLHADVFYNHVTNYIYARKLFGNNGSDSLIFVHDEPNRVFLYTQQDAVLKGAEISFDIHPHPFDWLHFENSFSFVNGEFLQFTDSTRFLPFTPSPRLQTELRAHMHEPKKRIANGYITAQMIYSFEQNKIFSAWNTETPTPAWAIFNIGTGFDLTNKKNRTVLSFSCHIQNVTNRSYQNHLSRLKYTETNQVTGRTGIFQPGRNIAFKLIIPVSIK